MLQRNTDPDLWGFGADPYLIIGIKWLKWKGNCENKYVSERREGKVTYAWILVEPLLTALAAVAPREISAVLGGNSNKYRKNKECNFYYT
jgi:hypothetical protein